MGEGDFISLIGAAAQASAKVTGVRVSFAVAEADHRH
jgi:hypothetical protein